MKGVLRPHTPAVLLCDKSTQKRRGNSEGSPGPLPALLGAAPLPEGIPHRSS